MIYYYYCNKSELFFKASWRRNLFSLLSRIFFQPVLCGEISEPEPRNLRTLILDMSPYLCVLNCNLASTCLPAVSLLHELAVVFNACKYVRTDGIIV